MDTQKHFTPYEPAAGEEYMNANQLGHFRRILEETRKELSQDIDRTVHTMQDEATVFADPNDRASQESDMALELRNRDRERKLIKKIDETIARIDADDYITLIGRLKESYRCGGEMVMPTEIEDLLVTHPAVLQAHVVAIPDDRMGEVGVAFVVPRGDAPVVEAELLDFCAERLARFKVPRHLLTIRADQIPVTPSGRARKFLLTGIALERLGRAAPQPGDAPRALLS